MGSSGIYGRRPFPNFELLGREYTLPHGDLQIFTGSVPRQARKLAFVGSTGAVNRPYRAV